MKLLFLVLLLIFVGDLYAQKAKTSSKKAQVEKARAEKALADALEQKRIADIERGIYTPSPEEEAINKANRHLRYKIRSLAQNIALKSLDATDKNVAALLACEAYELNKITGGRDDDSYIYWALFVALDNLRPRTKLHRPPAGIKRMGSLRAICVRDSLVYALGSAGYLFRWAGEEVRIFADGTRPLSAELPDVMGQNRAAMRAMAITQDGKYLLCGGNDAYIKVFERERPHQPPRSISIEGSGRLRAILTIPNSDTTEEALIVFASSDGSLQMARLGDKAAKILAQDAKNVEKMAVTNDGQYLFCVGDSSQPQIYNWANNTLKREWALENKFAANAKCSAIACSPNGKYLAIGYHDGGLRIWDFLRISSDGWYTPEMQYFHSAVIEEIVFSPDSKLLGVASLDKTASIWTIEAESEYYRGEYIQPFRDPKFVPIRLQAQSDWVVSVAFSPDSKQMYTGTQDGVIRSWQTDMRVYAEELCELVQAPLNDADWRKYFGTDDPTGKELYILLPYKQRRSPLSTCAGK